ncbi:hypothetical protein quinque_009476 [Culex quinquefasciatus]
MRWLIVFGVALVARKPCGTSDSWDLCWDWEAFPAEVTIITEDTADSVEDREDTEEVTEAVTIMEEVVTEVAVTEVVVTEVVVMETMEVGTEITGVDMAVTEVAMEATVVTETMVADIITTEVDMEVTGTMEEVVTDTEGTEIMEEDMAMEATDTKSTTIMDITKPVAECHRKAGLSPQKGAAQVNYAYWFQLGFFAVQTRELLRLSVPDKVVALSAQGHRGDSAFQAGYSQESLYKYLILSWKFKEIIFVEDVRSVPIGRVLKIKSGYTAVKFLLLTTEGSGGNSGGIGIDGGGENSSKFDDTIETWQDCRLRRRACRIISIRLRAGMCCPVPLCLWGASNHENRKQAAP